MISTRRKLVEQDVDTDEAPVGEDVGLRRWPDAAGSGSPFPDSVRCSSISFTHFFAITEKLLTDNDQESINEITANGF